MNRYQKIASIVKNKLEKTGLEYKTVSQNLGISQNRFSSCIEGQGKFNAVEFLSVCLFLNLNFDDFKSCL